MLAIPSSLGVARSVCISAFTFIERYLLMEHLSLATPNDESIASISLLKAILYV